MAMRSLMPFARNFPMLRPSDENDPFLLFRREMNRLFDDALGGFGFPGPAMPNQALAPRIDVSESEQEIQIKAELPGIDQKDVEVMLADDVLTIRGEKKAEREEKNRNYHVMERAQGVFSRSLPLPFAVDPSQVKADFKDGVLTITIPKPKEAQEKTHKIEVTRDTSATAGQTQTSDAGSSTAASSSAAPAAAQKEMAQAAAE
jgi:HSP20 family protein